MTDWIKTNKMYLLIGFVIFVALGIYYFMPTEKGNSENGLDTEWQETENKSVENEQEKEMETGIETNVDVQEKIVIDVKGAVTTPGVYEASIGDRVIDIIERAGGLLDSADKNNINFAMKVVDEMVLYIPAVGEQIQTIAGGVATGGSLQEASAADGKVNLNTASESDLQTLPGIGPSKALAIIEYRETNGSYKTIEELMEISGIGEKTFEKLKEHITVR
jgi:competence protein ComEA